MIEEKTTVKLKESPMIHMGEPVKKYQLRQKNDVIFYLCGVSMGSMMKHNMN